MYRRTPMPRCDCNKAAKQLYWNQTSEWSFINRQMSGTSSDNEWQRVTTSGTTSDNKWQRVVQRVTTNDSEWQLVTTNGTTSDNEWQRVTTNDNEWQRVEWNNKWQRVAVSNTTSDNEWQQMAMSDSKWQQWYNVWKRHSTLQRMDDCRAFNEKNRYTTTSRDVWLQLEWLNK